MRSFVVPCSNPPVLHVCAADRHKFWWMSKGARMTPRCRSKLGPQINNLPAPIAAQGLEDSNRLAVKVREMFHAKTATTSPARSSATTPSDMNAPVHRDYRLFDLSAGKSEKGRAPNFFSSTVLWDEVVLWKR